MQHSVTKYSKVLCRTVLCAVQHTLMHFIVECFKGQSSAVVVALPGQMIPALLTDCVAGFRVNRQLHEVGKPVHVLEVCQ